jgi:hypothetical protein
MKRLLGRFRRCRFGAFYFVWVVLVATRTATAVVPSIGPGDFESGNLLPPFNSPFTRSNDMTTLNSWNIVSHDTLNPNWADFYDHTLGNAQGHFFIAKGTPGVEDYMLSTTVPVTRNTSYTLSGWVAALSSDPPSALGIRIFDGAAPLKTGQFAVSSPTGVWQPFSLSLNTFNADFLAVYFFGVQGLNSNSLAFDDIRLVPEPAAGALMVVGLAGCMIGRWGRRCRVGLVSSCHLVA